MSIEEEIEFSDTMSIDITKSIESNETRLHCQKCKQKWTKKALFTKHMIYGANHALTCYLCNIVFDEVSIYNKHILDVHNRKCEECNKKFPDAQVFKHHLIDNHKNDKVNAMNTVNQEPKKQDDESEKLKVAIRTTERVTLKSQKSGKFTNTSDKPLTNKEEKSSLTNPFVCVICEKKFENMKTFSLHMYNSHIKTIKCEICQKSFDNKIKLDEHVDTSHSYKIYKCDVCSSTFTQQKYYELHFNGYCIKK